MARPKAGGRVVPATGIIGETPHRAFAEIFADMEPGMSELTQLSPEVSGLRSRHTGVLLVYPIRETLRGAVSVGFEFYFPPNGIPFEMNLTVAKNNIASSLIRGGAGSSTSSPKKRRG